MAVCAVVALGASASRPDDPAPAVISLSPLASAVLLELDAADALIGTDARSQQLDGLRDVPLTEIRDAAERGPDLVIVPRIGDRDEPVVRGLRAAGVLVVEFDPHDFDDAFDLYRLLGRLLAREAAAHRLVSERSRDLAILSHESVGRRRPRVAALLEIEPLVLAGGHSYVTDLIEVAGAESVTHGSDELEIPVTPARLAELAPELVLIATRRPLSPAERASIAAIVPSESRLASIEIDPETIWRHGALETARRIRALVLDGSTARE